LLEKQKTPRKDKNRKKIVVELPAALPMRGDLLLVRCRFRELKSLVQLPVPV
jgi:hypothetical protein